ncbi:hypothetical protein H6F74_09565 [Trichocoleus sp. FACHB-90]|uniref:hypothetical protein n=1 Tax=Cyanophyceae TaxID=3028117 RepID=UPI0016885ED8|nr:hypothetical protein [Trichocoleus sp. FACHB-90]MBD1926489.1 hypothetical protein [Trichocoleus sp. FACHB-90]
MSIRLMKVGSKFVFPNSQSDSQLVRVGSRIINLDAIAHAEYDPTGSTLEIFFQILPSIVLSDDEAECLWKLLEQSALDVMPEENAIAS